MKEPFPARDFRLQFRNQKTSTSSQCIQSLAYIITPAMNQRFENSHQSSKEPRIVRSSAVPPGAIKSLPEQPRSTPKICSGAENGGWYVAERLNFIGRGKFGDEARRAYRRRRGDRRGNEAKFIIASIRN